VTGYLKLYDFIQIIITFKQIVIFINPALYIYKH